MGALDRMREAASVAAATATRGVQDAATAAESVARAIHRDQIEPMLASGDAADVPDPRGPRPWPVLVAEPFCLVRLPAAPGDAIAVLAVSLAGAGLAMVHHRDGWGFTTARTERIARASVWDLWELQVPLPGPLDSVTLFDRSGDRVHVRAWRGEVPGGTTLRLDVEKDAAIGTGLGRPIADALAAFVATWDARGVPVVVGPWREKSRASG